MKEYVWFFGPSCAGKEYVIRRLADNDTELAKNLVLPGDIHVCNWSIEYKTNQRQNLPDHLLKKHRDLSGALLIKGQTSDLTPVSTLDLLSENLQDLRQIVVFVYSPPDVLDKRRQLTRLPDPYWDGWDVAAHANELAIQQSLMKRLEEKYPVRWNENTGLPSDAGN